jgi:hypothetical protein
MHDAEYFTSAVIICYEYNFHYWQCAPHVTALVRFSVHDVHGNDMHRSAA